MADPATRIPWRATVVVELRDGQCLDLRNVPPDAAADLLAALLSPRLVRCALQVLAALARERSL